MSDQNNTSAKYINVAPGSDGVNFDDFDTSKNIGFVDELFETGSVTVNNGEHTYVLSLSIVEID
jgi:hypothetical protein